PIYYADERAKALMTENEELRAQLIATFGAQTYTPDGTLNRAYLAGIVFQNDEKLAQLNALVHPIVQQDGERWQALQQDAPYTLREAALLFESGIYRSLDKIIVVTAPEDLRIARVVARDQTTPAAVRARMDKQWPEERKVALADFVIYNDGEQLLIPQVLDIHKQLLGETKKLCTNRP
ncbi:MAG: dephospho-CoA kinase, partial [Bacteroidetes bacterium]